VGGAYSHPVEGHPCGPGGEGHRGHGPDGHREDRSVHDSLSGEDHGPEEASRSWSCVPPGSWLSRWRKTRRRWPRAPPSGPIHRGGGVSYGPQEDALAHGWRSSWPPRGASSTTWANAGWTCPASRPSSWTRRTGCWTWASAPDRGCSLRPTHQAPGDALQRHHAQRRHALALQLTRTRCGWRRPLQGPPPTGSRRSCTR
jgi:hypothetical protein